MNPDLLLRIVAALAGFLLKTTLAFGVCLVFSWLVDAPNRRFMIWLGFLSGATTYWLSWLANGVLAGGQLSAGAQHASDQPATSTVGAFQIPGSWAFPLGVALRVIGVAYLLVLSYSLLTHFKRQRHLKWVLGFTTKPPVEIAKTFSAACRKPPCGPFEIVSAIGGHISGDIRLDTADYLAAATLS